MLRNVHYGDLASDVPHTPTCPLYGKPALPVMVGSWKESKYFLGLAAKKCISPDLILYERSMAERKSTLAFQRLFKERQNCRAFLLFWCLACLLSVSQIAASQMEQILKGMCGFAQEGLNRVVLQAKRQSSFIWAGGGCSLSFLLEKRPS